jgi:hypothetical protein
VASGIGPHLKENIMVLMSRPLDFLDPRALPATEPTAPAKPGEMLGLVLFTTHRGELVEAILDLQGRWHCPRLPVLERPLNTLYDPRRVGPAPFGVETLERAATWLKGTVQLPPDRR